jgi:hypothetical protein
MRSSYTTSCAPMRRSGSSRKAATIGADRHPLHDKGPFPPTKGLLSAFFDRVRPLGRSRDPGRKSGARESLGVSYRGAVTFLALQLPEESFALVDEEGVDNEPFWGAEEAARRAATPLPCSGPNLRGFASAAGFEPATFGL